MSVRRMLFASEKGPQEIQYEKAQAKYEEALRPIQEVKKALLDPGQGEGI